MEFSIQPMVEADLEAADHVMRLAFGTFLKLPEPLQFMGDAGIGVRGELGALQRRGASRGIIGSEFF